MTQVKIEFMGSVQTVSLEAALTPEAPYEHSGVAEHAQATAQAACDAVGRLLAVFVESGRFTLKQAREIAGQSRPAELVPERTPREFIGVQPK